MKHLAAIFALSALAAMVPMLINLNGTTAIVFSFIGFPALGLALLLHAVARWRAGAFHLTDSSGNEKS
jgi:hypothetical protein